MSADELILLLFSVDIAVHLGVTIFIGLWLERHAREQVRAASEEVKAALVLHLPMLGGVLADRVETAVREAAGDVDHPGADLAGLRDRGAS